MGDYIRLMGRLLIRGDIKVITGLHIGGSGAAFNIGGVDNPVIVDGITGQPYIPGSSLKGKMRSLTEKHLSLEMFAHAGVDHIHTAEESRKNNVNRAQAEQRYNDSPVAKIYGVPAQDFNLPTRLYVRDVYLNPESANLLLQAKTALPFTEVKTEVSIDRVTSQANPRDVERVPAGALFSNMEMVFNIYDYRSGDGERAYSYLKDIELIPILLEGMQLLEEDYLGGYGSRGSGKVAFQNLRLSLRPSLQKRDTSYELQPEVPLLSEHKLDTLQALLEQVSTLQNEVHQHLSRTG